MNYWNICCKLQQIPCKSVFPVAIDYTELSEGLNTDRASQGFVAAHAFFPLAV